MNLEQQLKNLKKEVCILKGMLDKNSVNFRVHHIIDEEPLEITLQDHILMVTNTASEGLINLPGNVTENFKLDLYLILSEENQTIVFNTPIYIWSLDDADWTSETTFELLEYMNNGTPLSLIYSEGKWILVNPLD